MNDHSKDSQTRYLREAAIVLAKVGFQSDEIHADRLCIDINSWRDIEIQYQRQL